MKKLLLALIGCTLSFTMSPAIAEYIPGDLTVQNFLLVDGPDIAVGLNDGRWKGDRPLNRALVHGWDDELIINYDKDFENGVLMRGPFRIWGDPWLQSPEGGHELRLRTDRGPEIGSSTGRIDFWYNGTEYNDIFARNITAGQGGNVYATEFIRESDERAKENIRPIGRSQALLQVLQLQGVEYNVKEDALELDRLGFIAQQVEQVVPQVVYPVSDTELKGIDYQGIIPLLVESIKQQQELIIQQQAQIENLQKVVVKHLQKK